MFTWACHRIQLLKKNELNDFCIRCQKLMQMILFIINLFITNHITSLLLKSKLNLISSILFICFT